MTNDVHMDLTPECARPGRSNVRICRAAQIFQTVSFSSIAAPEDGRTP